MIQATAEVPGTGRGAVYSSAAPANKPGRFVFVDSLRGLAALSVLLFHATEGHHIATLAPLLPAPLVALLSHGDFGVEVFFVLSGFVIAHSMARDDVDVRYVGRFMLRRSIRLDPPYWVSIGLTLGMAWIASREVTGKSFIPPTAAQLGAHLIYLPNLLRFPLINVAYWTLCLEIQFYLSFSLLMIGVTRLRRLWPGPEGEDRAFFLVFAPCAVVADLWPLGMAPFQVPGLFLGHWHLFMAGVLVWRAALNPRNRTAWVVALANLALLLVAVAKQETSSLIAGWVGACGLLVAGRTGGLTTWLRARPLQFLGAISYSLYLSHNPITGAAFRIAYKLTGRNAILEAMWLLVVTGICILAAWLMYRVIEAPSLRFSRRLGSKRSAGTAR